MTAGRGLIDEFPEDFVDKIGTRRLAELVARAIAAFEKMTPEQQRRHRDEQRLSFAYGNLRIDQPVSRAAFDTLIRTKLPHWSAEDRAAWLDAHAWDLP